MNDTCLIESRLAKRGTGLPEPPLIQFGCSK
jgi:hypothetical protein